MSKAKQILKRAMVVSGAAGISERSRLRPNVQILVYHRIGAPNYPWIYKSMPQSAFNQQMAYLSRNFNVLTLEELVEIVRRNEEAPKKSVVVTFDDGYRDNYTNALPVLESYGIPATLFLTSGPIRERRLFWWDHLAYSLWHTQRSEVMLERFGRVSLASNEERLAAIADVTESTKRWGAWDPDLVEKWCDKLAVEIPPELVDELILSQDDIQHMQQSCFSFGCHTVEHPVMTNMAPSTARVEMEKGLADFEELSSQKFKPFAFPNGESSHWLARMAEDCGYDCSVTCDAAPISGASDIFRLGRMTMSTNFDEFRLALSGLSWVLTRGTPSSEEQHVPVEKTDETAFTSFCA